MKNLQKINRKSLKEIQGGAKHQCNFDTDCAPTCAICRDLLGTRVCVFLASDPFTC